MGKIIYLSKRKIGDKASEVMRKVEDAEEMKMLLHEMIRFVESEGSPPTAWFKYFQFLTIALPTAWTLLELLEPIDLSLAEMWEETHGAWIHGPQKDKTSSHNVLGMAYAQYCEQYGGLENISLRDRPDLSATCGGKSVRGDIGQCSPWAFFSRNAFTDWFPYTMDFSIESTKANHYRILLQSRSLYSRRYR